MMADSLAYLLHQGVILHRSQPLRGATHPCCVGTRRCFTDATITVKPQHTPVLLGSATSDLERLLLDKGESPRFYSVIC